MEPTSRSQFEIEKDFKDSLYIPESQNWDKWIVLTHAWLETGAFGSDLADKNNFFGIKPYKGFTYPIYSKVSPEYIDGVKTMVKSDFATYPNPYTALTDYCRLIRQYHPKTFESRNVYKDYFKYIASWSTAPDYTQKLIELYDDLKKRGKFVIG